MKQFVFSLFLIILISTASAQVYDYFDLTRGNLPDSTVISLTIKSPNEFIIGTNNGYSYVKGNSLEICSTLKSNRIKDIEFGTNGILWIATDIGLIKKEGNKQTLYDKTNSDLKTNNIRCLQLNNGDLWLGTYSGLYKYDGKDFSCFNTSNSHLPSDTIREILIDTNERVLVLSRRHLSFIDKYNQISSIKAPDNSLFSRMIVENDTVIISSYHKAFTIVNDSTLILNYSDNNPTDRINGVCNLSGKMHTFSSTKRIINTTNRNSVQLITSSLIDQIDYISLIKTDSSGNYYIGTPNKGLIIIEASKKKLKVSDSLMVDQHIVFPNPFKSQINYSIANNESNFSIALYDIQGKVVYHEEIESKNKITSGNIGAILLRRGIYFFEIKMDEKNYTYNLLKL